MITIVNYGMGNLGSMQNMLRRIGAVSEIVSDPESISGATKIILPGVGAFDAAMKCINSTPKLRQVLDHKANVEKIPILGICLGMQLLTEGSEEGTIPGLGWIKGHARRFPKDSGLKIPHMGWNEAKPLITNHLTEGLPADQRYYFVHSYYVKADAAQNSLMSTHYGIDFDSAVVSGNIFGVQFHPEKSHRFGMALLNNFSKL